MNAETERKKVGLALGGGAGRGFAHIGVLDEFVKAGIPIDCICGCSMGAFIGSIFAAGTDLSMLARQRPHPWGALSPAIPTAYQGQVF